MTGGREMAPQTLEKIESAPGKDMAPEVSDSEDAGAKLGEAFASLLTALTQDPLVPEALLADGLQMAPQRFENLESAPARGGGEAPVVFPSAVDRRGFRRPNVRAALNGVMAC